MSDMDDLIAWLRAQLDEQADKAVRSCGETHPQQDAYCFGGHPDAFRLAEIEAQRKLLAILEEADQWYMANIHVPAGEVQGLWTAVKLLAEAYADRPGYCERWRP